ncbi:MAG: hypothetical protein WA405_13125, partial [Candidatus Acidiferrales bacterium]
APPLFPGPPRRADGPFFAIRASRFSCEHSFYQRTRPSNRDLYFANNDMEAAASAKSSKHFASNFSANTSMSFAAICSMAFASKSSARAAWTLLQFAAWSLLQFAAWTLLQFAAWPLLLIAVQIPAWTLLL